VLAAFSAFARSIAAARSGPSAAGRVEPAVEAFNDLLKKHGKRTNVENPLLD
jgi:hypothetical protein